MKSTIISNDYRNYLQEQGIQLSDWDRATLIIRHKQLSPEEKMEALRELGDATSDEELKKQIRERISLSQENSCFKNYNDDLEFYKDWRFEGRFVDLPLCFRQKDVVKIVGTEAYGVVLGDIRNDEEEEAYRKAVRKGTFSDFRLNVDIVYEGEKLLDEFRNVSIPPTELEYAGLDENDPRKRHLDELLDTFADPDLKIANEDITNFGEIDWEKYDNGSMEGLILEESARTF